MAHIPYRGKHVTSNDVTLPPIRQLNLLPADYGHQNHSAKMLPPQQIYPHQVQPHGQKTFASINNSVSVVPDHAHASPFASSPLVMTIADKTGADSRGSPASTASPRTSTAMKTTDPAHKRSVRRVAKQKRSVPCVTKQKRSVQRVAEKKKRFSQRVAEQSDTKGPRQDAAERFFCFECQIWTCDSAKHRKNTYERQSRMEQAGVLRSSQNISRLYLGHDCAKVLTPGNGRAAGLYFDKINNMRVITAVCGHLLEEGYKAALREGRIPEWQAELSAIATAGETTGEVRPPWLQSFDGDFVQPCDHVLRPPKDSKEPRKDLAFYSRCIVHDTADWTRCNDERARAVFSKNVAATKAGLEAQREHAPKSKRKLRSSGSGTPKLA